MVVLFRQESGMGFRVSAITRAGGAVSVIVEDRAAALAKFDEYREDGFTAIVLKDLDGKLIEIDRLGPGD